MVDFLKALGILSFSLNKSDKAILSKRFSKEMTTEKKISEWAGEFSVVLLKSISVPDFNLKEEKKMEIVKKATVRKSTRKKTNKKSEDSRESKIEE